MTKFNHRRFLWKYVRTGILAGLKRQVENHSKIANSENTLNSKISKSEISKTWRGKSENMLDITSQTSLFLQFNIIKVRNTTYPTIGGEFYTFYIRLSWNWGTNCPFFIIICDVSDASSHAFCHCFARWHIILFHIFKIGGLLEPQFFTCINTNSIVEEDSLFPWSWTEIFYDSSKSYRTGFCSGLSNSLFLSPEFQIIPNNNSTS